MIEEARRQKEDIEGEIERTARALGERQEKL